MASFQAKIGWKRVRNRVNKNYRFVKKTETIASFRPYPNRNRKFQTKSKKIQKIKKHLYGFISSQYRMEKVEKEREQKLSWRFVLPRRVIENYKKNSNKNEKN